MANPAPATYACLSCGADTPLSKHALTAKWCPDCRKKRMQMVACKLCGQSFVRRRSGPGRSRIYCSEECRRRARPVKPPAPVKPPRIKTLWPSPIRIRRLCPICERSACQDPRACTRTYERIRKRMGRYKITKADAWRLERKEVACGLCGGVAVDVDHDHGCCPGRYSCGKCFRGFLCRSCNRNLGVLEELGDDVLSTIRTYLECGASK